MPTREKRRLLVDATLIGAVLTLLVAAADALGWLTPLERWFYDQRALLCQHWMPPPTDRLVHVDIDDASQATVGRWPWPRTDVAELLDELHKAGAKAVALDVTFTEPQPPELVKPNKFVMAVDHDARLADAIRESGNCVLAAMFPFRVEAVDPDYPAVKAELLKHPERTEAEVVEALRSAGHGRLDLADVVRRNYPAALRDALLEKIQSLGAAAGTELLYEVVVFGTVADTEILRSALLPKTNPLIDTTVLGALRSAQVRDDAFRELRRQALGPAPTAPPVAAGHLSGAPIAGLTRAAAAVGFVDYTQSSDARIRSVPLLLEHDGALYPQLGLALAWRLLDADPKGLRITADSVTIPRGALGDLVIPVHTAPARDLFEIGRDVPLSANLSWFGGRDWTTMYRGGGAAANQHVPVGHVFQACRVRRQIESNHREALDAMNDVLTDELYEEFQVKKLRPDDVAGYTERIDKVMAKPFIPPPGDPKRGQAEAAVAKLREIREADLKLDAELNAHRAQLRSIFQDKAVLVGWTANGVAADFFPTSLHPRCPGVVLHGVVFNQVMTGEVWRTLPPWVTLLVTLLVGALVTLAVSFLPPAKSLTAAALLVVGYLLVNGYLLFDYGNLVLGAAAPVVAVGVVFTGGTAAKLVVERWERARITRRLGSYVDPKLVDYVLKHPEQSLFEGQIREMTVVFCDVAGFTKLTETRGTETVTMLNELWGVVVPTIKQHDGLINKFMGDGIMFFYGAPDQSPHQARDAVTAVLAIRKAVERFNKEVAPARNWPALGMRCGVSTGNMIVGDAGHTTNPSEVRADYTVLGDNVNLGSRLEAANKAVGTGALVTERTWELSRDAGILFRPVGKLCVVGKKTGVMTYEPMALLDNATGQQKELASATKAVVESFMAGSLAECMEAIGRMEAAHGRSKLTDLYRERCEWFLREPSPEPFDCQIVLTEK
jgi:CHASE2 domain-containing sensor protein/class 3 adenylate cyclase